MALIRQQAEQVRANPRNAAAHGRLGLVYEANAMFSQARTCFANAAKLAERAPLWNYHLAIALRQTGDFDGSLELLGTLAEQHPKFAALQHRLGDALFESGRLEEAETAFQKAVQLNRSAPVPCVSLADVKIRQGDYAAAVELLKRAIRRDPDYKAAHYSLGIAYRGLGRLEEATRELNKGRDAERRYMPDSLSAELAKYAVYPSARVDRAKQMLAAGQAPRAAALLEKGLETRPNDLMLLNQLARTYLALNRKDQALTVLLRAKRANDQSCTTYVNLARCCTELGRLDEALRHANRAVTLGPTTTRSYVARALVLWAMERYADALPDLETAARLRGHMPELHVMLGETCRQLDRDVEAQRHFQNAVRLSPELFTAQLKLCAVSLKLGRPDEAAPALAAARRLKPDHPKVLTLERKLTALRAEGPVAGPAVPPGS
ncbi:MAG: tetratricopeptide repeat protein [Planctomycetes bacterium]|nr:tetratricopeptide repeat protein [Planctomycetota bacterium]